VIQTTSTAKIITLSNTQTVALTISSISVSGDFSEVSTCPIAPKTLRAGASCKVSVTFTPTALGVRGGSLSVDENSPGSNQTVPLSGNGTAPTLVSIAVSPITSSIAAGDTQQFSATGTYDNGTTLNLTNLAKWSSSTPSVATIKSGGLAKGVTSGTSSITATLNKASGTVLLTVMPAVLTSISVTPAVASVPSGDNQQFTAKGTYSNGSTQSLSGSVTWSSTATSVASVNSGGLATGATQGTATITATEGSLSASATLHVKPPVLASIVVTPSASSIAAGYSQQFMATGILSNGSRQNLTNVQWSSSANSVAIVSSAGVASGLAQGTTSITAISGSFTNSAVLTVTAPVLTSIAISPGSASIASGMSQQFAATGNYTDGSTQNLTNAVNWNSDATTVATIAAGGLATGTGVGVVNVTATSGAFSASATLTVGPPVLVSLAITAPSSSFALGTSQQFTATGTYSDGSTQNLTNFATWSTADSTIATVNAQGIVGSVAVGSTTVTAFSGSISGSASLTVTPALLVSIAVTPALPAIPQGMTQQFAATGTFTDGSMQNITSTAQWSSDTPAVATISNALSPGLATTAAQGTANITASVGSVSGSTTLSVTAAALISLAITPSAPSIALGTTQQFTATGTFTDGSTQDLTGTAAWSSDTVSTATINSAGLASSVAIGAATVTANSGSFTASTILTVTAAVPVSITINPAAATIPVGTTQQFTATGTFTDGTVQDVTQSGQWSSTAASVATISDSTGTSGLAATLGPGTTTIGISLGGVTSTASLTVTPAALLSIAISPQTPVIAIGATQQFTATGTYSDGSTQDLTSVVTWSSSDATIAIISNNVGSCGLATSSGQGTVTITAAFQNIFSSTNLSVEQLSSIAVTPPSISIAVGYTEQFTAIATYGDGSTQDITASATWSSSSPNIAAVNSSGLATGLLAGATTVSASSGLVTGSAVLTVNSPVPVSLMIAPANPTVFVGAPQQFTATLIFSDGSSMDVTTAVSWSSSSPAVASVSSTGLAAGLAGGSSTLQATWGANALTATTGMTVSLPTVSITPSVASMAVSATAQFNATVIGSANQNVTWSVDVAAGGNPSLGTISSSGLYTAPPMIGSHTVTAVAQANSASLGTATLTVGSLVAVPNTFFGMHLNVITSPIPGTIAGTARIWDSAFAQWPYLNPASDTFAWTNLDAVLADYQAAGINDILYTLWRVPNWASSNPADTSCVYAVNGPSSYGECDLPADINPDGTGTNLIWRTWVQNIAQHVNAPGYSSTHAHIGYWEPCNECFRSPTLQPGYVGGSVSYRGTYAQLVRMMQDARCIIVGNPGDAITALNTTCGQAGYPVVGIDPTAQMVMPSMAPGAPTGSATAPPIQVMQNLLYCTCANNSCSTSVTGCPTGSAGSAAVDIIDVHIYPKAYTPEQIPSALATVRSALNTGDQAKPIWSGEGGWGRNSLAAEVNYGDPDLEAAFAARFQVMIWASGLARSYWYEWDNLGNGTLWSPASIDGCTVAFGSGDICEAGTASEQVYSWMVGATLTGCSANGTTWTCALTQSSGASAEIVWDSSQTCSNGTCGTVSYSPSPIYVSYRDLTGASYPVNGPVQIGIKPILLQTQ
jgi:hypothetical protein